MELQQTVIAVDALGAVCQVILLGMLTSAGHWILARSSIMYWFWGRMTGRVDELLRCPACSGFWLGIAAWWCGIRPIDAFMPWQALSCIGTGILGTFITPVMEGVVLWGLSRAAIVERTDDSPEQDQNGQPIHSSVSASGS